MYRKITIGLLVLIVLAMVGVPEALATSNYLADFNAKYGTAGTRLDTCSTCHTSVPSRNPYGFDLDQQLKNLTNDPSNADQATVDKALTNIEPLDSDVDGFTNIVEINARTFPGNASDHPPTVTPTRTPTVTRTPERTPRVTETPRVTGTPAPVPVPEFPTVVLPVAAVMGLVMLLLYRRRG